MSTIAEIENINNVNARYDHEHVIATLLPLFNQLNTYDENIIDDACRSIRSHFSSARALAPTQPPLLDVRVTPFIQLGLLHPSAEVQATTLKQIDETLKTNREATLEWLGSNEMLISLVPLLGGKSTLSVAQATLNIFSTIANNDAKALLQQTAFIDAIKTCYINNLDSESAHLRVLELAVILTLLDPAEFTTLLQDPLLDALFKETSSANSTDTLSRLGELELIGRLGGNVGALEWIVQSQGKLFEVLRSTLSNVKDHDDSSTPPDYLWVNGVYQLVAQWCQSNRHIDLMLTAGQLQLPLFSSILYCLESHRSSTLATRCVERAIEVIGIIGSHRFGLDHVLAQPELCKLFISFSHHRLDNIAVPSQHTLAIMLESKEARPTVTDDLQRLVMEIGDGHEIPKSAMKSISSPIEDVRVAALHLVQAFCLHQWGCQAMLAQPGLYEYLISRNETTKLIREWKFTIVQTLVTQQEALLNTENFNHQWLKLKEYHSRGVHYLPSEANVTIATQDM
ncbi:hypothetical protein SAMD00019534_017890 [Acytostelium subglobosum LB1]|uniref:hypothetical protein n=1 Tax=Acytostelium subglobosum LB1 TaxID=1410327 RepID=UPI0006450D9F|nr:hypothetical protein SAMD00019534_017890 [Acytostelium subglobosum LB1]GAM18614.1 hypothetical protein SAMD00019534_017890 [Acytostelium subglobosum LB1]|eukprot:XP_012757834.1 hypothetical protein SAMD00019534_017890 [Acytostelium subglobosum LB1]